MFFDKHKLVFEKRETSGVRYIKVFHDKEYVGIYSKQHFDSINKVELLEDILETYIRRFYSRRLFYTNIFF